MRFASRPLIRWGPLPSPRRRTNLCGICRRRDPTLFHVPTTVWLHYVGHEQRRQIVCIGCWRWLADAVDASAFWQKHAGEEPGTLWSPLPPARPSDRGADRQCGRGR
jgi:hypothetical protein